MPHRRPKYVISIIDKFLSGATGGRSGSLSINGNKIYSYNTVIAERSGNIIKLNNRKYSLTTTRQQDEIRNVAKGKGMLVMEYSGQSAQMIGFGGW